MGSYCLAQELMLLSEREGNRPGEIILFPPATQEILPLVLVAAIAKPVDFFPKGTFRREALFDSMQGLF